MAEPSAWPSGGGRGEVAEPAGVRRKRRWRQRRRERRPLIPQAHCLGGPGVGRMGARWAVQGVEDAEAAEQVGRVEAVKDGVEDGCGRQQKAGWRRRGGRDESAEYGAKEMVARVRVGCVDGIVADWWR